MNKVEYTIYDTYVTKMDKEEFKKLSKELVEILKENEDSYIHFDTREDYDGCYDVLLEVVGFRDLTEKEIKTQEQQERTQAFADEKGITFHDASVYLRLKEQGKV